MGSEAEACRFHTVGDRPHSGHAVREGPQGWKERSQCEGAPRAGISSPVHIREVIGAAFPGSAGALELPLLRRHAGVTSAVAVNRNSAAVDAQTQRGKLQNSNGMP